MMAHSWLEAMIGNSLDLWMLALVGVVLTGGVVASMISRKNIRPLSGESSWARRMSMKQRRPLERYDRKDLDRR
ncbi:MAG: hypothetical protein HKL90_08075 [Elusimicrobia bacterium]|nr:hypothetical protein [Elusimicrobiota bacterium]